MPKLSEWHIYGNEQQGRFPEVGYLLPVSIFYENETLGRIRGGVLKKMLF
jgi:hypothetical protein